MSHDDEYHANMVSMLELIWGEGYMAPGGPGNVAKLLDGIDLETPLIERARASAQRLGLADRCSFRVVEPGPLPFADASFDIVIISGAVTQTADAAALSRLFRGHAVLVPHGGTHLRDEDLR